MTRFWLRLASWFPNFLKRWVIIQATAEYTIKHPNKEVPSVTWDEVVRWLDD